MSLARQFAERVSALRYEDLPPEAIYWSKVAVLDTVGVTLAGAALHGADKANYNLLSVATTAATITPKGITGNFTVAASKPYDGDVTATVLTRTLNGVSIMKSRKKMEENIEKT